MFTSDEKNYLKNIPPNKKVKIYPFDKRSLTTANEIINSISNKFPRLEPKHLGASALKISGQNDLDISIFADPKVFKKYLPGLIELFGKPIHIHKTFIEWGFTKNGFEVQLYLTNPTSESTIRQIRIFETLRNSPSLLKQYEKLKESMNGRLFREYQKKKYEFYHSILDKNLKAILFDMVGVLIFKKPDYIAKSIDQINAKNIEKLFNHLDERQLLKDIKQQLKLSDFQIQKAVKQIPEKYERYQALWKLLPSLKKKYKLAVVNNGNSIALKYWKKKFNFSLFDVFINSSQVGFKKPNPKILLLTCKKLNVDPDECIFMDDNLENVKSTKILGMKTIFWKDKNKSFQIFTDLLGV